MDRKDILTIIPAAGRGSRMLSLTDNCAKSMIPIASKPLISYLLDQLIEENMKDVAIIVGYKKETIIDYVNMFYKNKLNIMFIEQKELLGLGHAIYEVTNQLDITKYSGIFIMLGDAIFTNNKIYKFDKSYIACKEMPDYSRWCIAVKDNKNHLVKLLDKPQTMPEINLALVGAYYFKDSKLFNKSVKEAINSGITIKGEYQISTAIEIYNKSDKISILTLTDVDDWLDFGELDQYNKNRKKINQSRFFNNINYNDDTVVKKSTSNKRKIQREIFWYLAMPKSLSKYYPDLISYDLDDTDPEYTIRYCEGNTVQEMWLYSNFNDEMWIKILSRIMSAIDDFKKTSKENTLDFYQFICNQLEARVNIDEFFGDKPITINGQTYDLPKIKNFFLSYLEKSKIRFSDSHSYICHGDMVFSNILYNIATNDIKLIDPRGNFCNNIIYGDTRYDIAKLAQCIIGDYDYIVNDLFTLTPNGYSVYMSKTPELKDILFSFITKEYDRKDIMFLTAIQFMTMIPLHKENKNHQKMMRYKAIELLDSIMKGA